MQRYAFNETKPIMEIKGVEKPAFVAETLSMFVL